MFSRLFLLTQSTSARSANLCLRPSVSLETKLEKMKSVKGKGRNVEGAEESVTSLNALESLKPVDKAVVKMTEIIL